MYTCKYLHIRENTHNVLYPAGPSPTSQNNVPELTAHIRPQGLKKTKCVCMYVCLCVCVSVFTVTHSYR